MSTHPGLQQSFLEHLRTHALPVTVFLINGVKLQGQITAADEACLLLQRENHLQLIYKHAVSTVMPATDVPLPALGIE